MDDTDASFHSKIYSLQGSNFKNGSTIYADNLPSDDMLDGDPGGSKNGSKTTESHPDYSVDTYFCFTFYVKNLKDTDFSFSAGLVLTTYNIGINSDIDLPDIVRFRLYSNIYSSNSSSETHDSITYAKLSSDGKTPELVSYSSSSIEANRQSATPFINSKNIFSRDYVIAPNEIIRFTLVGWLEGFDPDCKGSQPTQSSFSTKMTFSAL